MDVFGSMQLTGWVSLTDICCQNNDKNVRTNVRLLKEIEYMLMIAGHARFQNSNRVFLLTLLHKSNQQLKKDLKHFPVFVKFG